VIDVWLLYHCAHGVLDGPIGEFVVGVLLPDGFQVEVWATHLWFQELQVSCVRHRVCGIIEVFTASRVPLALHLGIVVFFGDVLAWLGSALRRGRPSNMLQQGD